VVEQHLHLRLVVAIGHLEAKVPRLDVVERLARPRRLLVLDHEAELLAGELEEHRHGADEDLLAVLHGDALARREALAADERAVGRALVLEQHVVALAHEHGVARAHLRVRHHDLVVGRSSDGDDVLREVGEVQLADDRAVLARRLGAGRRRRSPSLRTPAGRRRALRGRGVRRRALGPA
jgi:hypothetical protein